VVTAYWDPALHLCHSCAADLARQLDSEDVWPPAELDALVVIVADDLPLYYDGRQLQRLCAIQHEYGSRLGVEVVSGRRMLRFRDPIALEGAEIAARHHGLLVSAWEEQDRKQIKCCDHCMGPFVLVASNATKCPVCAKGKRTIVVKIPFVSFEQRKAS
jgi:hypothetical protein